MDRLIARIYLKLLRAIETGNAELAGILADYVEHLENRLAAIR